MCFFLALLGGPWFHQQLEKKTTELSKEPAWLGHESDRIEKRPRSISLARNNFEIASECSEKEKVRNISFNRTPKRNSWEWIWAAPSNLNLTSKRLNLCPLQCVAIAKAITSPQIKTKTKVSRADEAHHVWSVPLNALISQRKFYWLGSPTAGMLYCSHHSRSAQSAMLSPWTRSLIMPGAVRGWRKTKLTCFPRASRMNVCSKLVLQRSTARNGNHARKRLPKICRSGYLCTA